MNCKFCGNNIEDGATYCSKCGSSRDASCEDAAYEADYVTEPYDNSKVESYAKKSLVFGILGLVIGSIVGFIFGIVGKTYANKYADMAGVLKGKAKAGNILSSIAIPLGIINFISNVIAIVKLVQTLI